MSINILSTQNALESAVGKLGIEADFPKSCEQLQTLQSQIKKNLKIPEELAKVQIQYYKESGWKRNVDIEVLVERMSEKYRDEYLRAFYDHLKQVAEQEKTNTLTQGGMDGFVEKLLSLVDRCRDKCLDFYTEFQKLLSPDAKANKSQGAENKTTGPKIK